jgi:hypothetical protein
VHAVLPVSVRHGAGPVDLANRAMHRVTITYGPYGYL